MSMVRTEAPSSERSTQTRSTMSIDRTVALHAVAADGPPPRPAARAVANEKLAYSVKEAATAMGVSPDLVRRLIDTGELRSVRLAGRVVIPVVEVEQLLGIRREAPAPRQLVEAFAKLVGADLDAS
jgi:excisionase family DNA binding protein